MRVRVRVLTGTVVISDWSKVGWRYLTIFKCCFYDSRGRIPLRNRELLKIIRRSFANRASNNVLHSRLYAATAVRYAERIIVNSLTLTLNLCPSYIRPCSPRFLPFLFQSSSPPSPPLFSPPWNSRRNFNSRRVSTRNRSTVVDDKKARGRRGRSAVGYQLVIGAASTYEWAGSWQLACVYIRARVYTRFRSLSIAPTEYFESEELITRRRTKEASTLYYLRTSLPPSSVFQRSVDYLADVSCNEENQRSKITLEAGNLVLFLQLVDRSISYRD